jgi:hypothetical protein
MIEMDKMRHADDMETDANLSRGVIATRIGEGFGFMHPFPAVLRTESVSG